MILDKITKLFNNPEKDYEENCDKIRLSLELDNMQRREFAKECINHLSDDDIRVLLKWNTYMSEYEKVEKKITKISIKSKLLVATQITNFSYFITKYIIPMLKKNK